MFSRLIVSIMTYVSLKNHHLQTLGLLFFISIPALPECILTPTRKQCPPLFFTHVSFFYAQLIQGLSGNTDPVFFCFLFSLYPPYPPSSSPGKSVVSESEDEVQAAEVGGGGLRVAAEEKGIASHKPVETGD